MINEGGLIYSIVCYYIYHIAPALVPHFEHGLILAVVGRVYPEPPEEQPNGINHKRWGGSTPPQSFEHY